MQRNERQVASNLTGALQRLCKPRPRSGARERERPQFGPTTLAKR